MSLSRYRARARPYANALANFGTGMSLARFAYNNRNAIAARARSMMFNNTRSMRGARVSSGQGVTTQYDRKQIYRKKYMPRRKKRRWRKFVKRVLAVQTKSLGSCTIVRNNLIQNNFLLTPGRDAEQNFVQVALYPVRSGSSDELNDVNEIFTDTRLQPPTTKAIFMSGVLDITMRVQSLLNQTVTSGNPSLAAEIDVYEIMMRGPTGQTGEATTLRQAFEIGHTDTGTIPGQTQDLLPTRRGWTPFDSNAALSQHRIKIMKKTKYFLSAEQTATYQVRDPKNHIYSRDSIPGSDSANWPGVTRWIFIVFKPIPGYNYVAAPNNDILRLNVGVTRKYMYKINQDATDFDAYNT